MNKTARSHVLRGLAIGALLVGGVMACSQPLPSGPTGPRLELLESYGSPTNRSVAVHATVVEEPGTGALGLDDVAITLDPGGRAPVRKLEAILNDVQLAQQGPQAWPASLRVLPAQALPLLRRVQLALWLLDDKRPGVRTHTEVQLFGDGPTLGLTKVRVDGDKVTIHVLSLGAPRGTSGVAWGWASGQRSGDEITLAGTRQVLGAAGESVGLHIKRTMAPATAER